VSRLSARLTADPIFNAQIPERDIPFACGLSRIGVGKFAQVPHIKPAIQSKNRLFPFGTPVAVIITCDPSAKFLVQLNDRGDRAKEGRNAYAVWS